MSKKESFLAKAKRKTAKYVTNDGEEYLCQAMSERERAEYELSCLDDEGTFEPEKMAGSRRMLIQFCLLDDDGKQMFSPAERDQIGELDGQFAGDLFAFLRKLCGLDAEANDQLADTRKN